MTATEIYESRIRPLWRPKREQTISEWADENRVLSQGAAEPGRWRTARAPYLREIMDTIGNGTAREVWWQKSAQVGATEVLGNAVGYYIDQDPGGILVMQPTVEMGESWSKDRLQPMLKDSPALAAKVAENRSRDAANTITHKEFDGGTLDIAGANSPAGLASRPKRIILCDEVDRYPASAGAEGDPVNLARKRSTTYWNRVFYACSTPTIKGLSRIEKGFASGDQRRYYVPCPHCAGMQHLKWARIDFSRNGTAEDPVYNCEHCEEPIRNNQLPKMLNRGAWVAEAEFKGVASFHLNELYSPWSTWAKIVRDFLDAKKGGAEMLKTWRNTSMGETWEQSGETVEARDIAARAEGTPEEHELPDGALVITAGADVQHDRIEYEIVGWGVGEESWSLEYGVVHGSPAHAGTWEDFERRLTRAWGDNGAKPLVVGIDSGDGKMSDHVMAFCATRAKGRFGFLPFKGASKFDAPVWAKPNVSTSRPRAPWLIGSSQCKLRVYDCLNVKEPGARYMHFPDGRPEQYYRGLTAEKLVTTYRKGWPTQEWHKLYDRNEPLDCRVYAYAAMKILNPNFEILSVKREKSGENPQQAPVIPRKTQRMRIRI